MEEGGTAEPFSPEYRNPLRHPLLFCFPRPCVLGVPSSCWGWGVAAFLPFPVSDARCQPRTEEPRTPCWPPGAVESGFHPSRACTACTPCTGVPVRAVSQANGATGKVGQGGVLLPAVVPPFPASCLTRGAWGGWAGVSLTGQRSGYRG